MTVRRFSGLSDFLASAAFVTGYPYRNGYDDHAWDLGVSADDAKIRAVDGDIAITDRAAALIDTIEPEIGEVLTPQWISSVAGSRVVVPEFLRGLPTHMRRRVRSETAGRCIDIFVDISSSAGIDALDLVSRGCAIIALIETLQRCRVSVNLSIGMGCRSRSEPDREIWMVIPIESRPLDVSSASFVLAHPSFARNLCYRVLEKQNGCTLTWSKFQNDDVAKRAYLGLEEHDLFVSPAHLYDKLIINDPKKWVEDRVKQCLDLK